MSHKASNMFAAGPKIYLASHSPRRRELLQQIGVKFNVIDNQEEEKIYSGMPPAAYVGALALHKATAAAKRLANGLVIGADTVVVVDDQVLGKPVDLAEARSMLQRLSGRCHSVYTGVAVVDAATDNHYSDFSVSKVYFRTITAAEITAYIRTENVLDKAGSYAIQGRASLFIERIDGDYFSIVGLPLYRLELLFNKMGASLLQRASAADN